ADTYQLSQLLGINGERLKSRANGIDHRPVDPEAVHEFKSIGSSRTLPADTTDEITLQNLLYQLCEKIEARLKRRDLVGLSVQIMIRFYNRKTITRIKKLTQYIYRKDDIYEIAVALLRENWNQKPIRLLGVTVQDIAEKKDIAEQLNLFTYEE